MPIYDEVERESLDGRMAGIKQKIAQLEEGIADAVRDHPHHPWKYDQEIRRLTALKMVELERLAQLVDQRRSLGGGDRSDYRSSGSFFLPRGY
jgi:hypothetical protein